VITVKGGGNEWYVSSHKQTTFGIMSFKLVLCNNHCKLDYGVRADIALKGFEGKRLYYLD